jgi:macrolide-specific efflux system membrane fusion protein
MKLKLAAVVVLGAIGAGAVFYALGGFSADTTTATQYLTSPATVGDVTQEIAATGTLEAASRTGVTFGVEPWAVEDGATGPAPAATYPVTDVRVAVGDTVTAGAMLATADTTDLEAELDRATNDLKSAQVGLRAAKASLEDAEDADVTSQIRQAKQGLYSAENQLAEAERTVADLEDQIEAASLTAPVGGLVTDVAIAVGADAPAGAAVVIDAATFEVTTDVVESDLASVELGQVATVDIDALDTQVTGTVTAIAPQATGDGSVVSFPVTVTIDSAPADARAGMSADVTITIASAEDVLTIPSAALNGSDGDYTVMTLGADGTAVATPVGVGLVTDSLAEVTAGLTEGTAVVTGTAADLLDTANGGQFAGPGGGVVVGGGAFPGSGPRVERANGGN